MKIKTKELLDVLKVIKPGVDSKERLEQSNSFVFSKGYVYTFNDEITIMHPFDMDFEGAVPANEFYALLSKVKDEEIDISTEEKEKSIIIKGQNFDAQIKLEDVFLPIIESDINEVENWYKLPTDFNDAIKTVTMAVSKNLAVPVLACVHWKDNLLESCDNFRILQWKLTGNFDENFEAAIFGDSLIKIVDFGLDEVGISKAWVIFKNSKTGLIAGVKRFLAQYPDLEQLKSKFAESDNNIEINFPTETISTLERAEIFATADETGDKFVNLQFKRSKLTISSITSLAKFREVVKTDNKIKEEFSFTARVDLLKDILKLTNIAEVCLDPPVIKFETDNVYHLVLLEG